MAQGRKDKVGPRPSDGAPVPKRRQTVAKEKKHGVLRPRSAPFHPLPEPAAPGVRIDTPRPGKRPAFAPHIEDQIPTEQVFLEPTVVDSEQDQSPSAPEHLAPAPPEPNVGRHSPQQKKMSLERSPKADSFQATYRIAPPGVEGLTEFGETALRKGGVFIRTDHAPPVGTHVMVSVVHPVCRDEFLLEGDVVGMKASMRRSGGIAVQFLRRDPAIETEYEYFVALGLPDDERAPPSQSDRGTDEIVGAPNAPDTVPPHRDLSVGEDRERRGSTIDIEITELQIIGELTPKEIHVRPILTETSDEIEVAQRSGSSKDSDSKGGRDR